MWLRRVASRSADVDVGGHQIAVPQRCRASPRRGGSGADLAALITPVTAASAVRDCKRADVRDLPAGLEIERRRRQHDESLFSFLELIDRLRAVAVVLQQLDDLRADRRRARTRENRLAAAASSLAFRSCLPGHASGSREGALAPRLFALTFHRLLEAFGVEPQPLRACQIFDEVARQAVGVVQLERLVAADHLVAARAPARARPRAVGSPSVSTTPKRSSSLRTTCTIASRLAVKLRIRVAHLADDDVDELVAGTARVSPSLRPCRMARRMILRST